MALLEASEAVATGQQFVSMTVRAVTKGISLTYSTAKPLTKGTLLASVKSAQLAVKGVKAGTHKIGDGSTKFKALVNKGDLHPIEVSSELVKDFKKDLKKRGVDFAVEKGADGKTYIHFIGKDADTIKHALSQARTRLEGSIEQTKRPQTRSDLANHIQAKAQEKKLTPPTAIPKQTLKAPKR
ncbi:PcfB family protein [Arcanobacterium phocisimile]|uniref:PcfB family protein n=1 Tax=Arcanobacterium phocisimile TaxID=1302235 RepID=A0ABX7IG03_9ACTO|nr:PcfB family protein [Arcanobacterium phocisimile]QRV02061.1 PcfB family protein [Arcanobacterium phocisimile]